MEGVRSHIIDVVFDTHREYTIKNAERSNRGSTAGIQLQNIALGNSIQQLRKFLSSLVNNAILIRFLLAEWKTPKLRGKLNDKQLDVANDETCLHISNGQWPEVACLQSNQEEADTRIKLHAAHATAECYRAVVVTYDDIDVMVICLAFSAGISCPLFQICRTKSRVRYIAINKLRHCLGYGVC